MSTYNVKYCVVPECHNTSWTARDKLFFRVPRPGKIRKIWGNVINGGRDRPPLSANILYICEDHFELENDLQNYVKYKLGFTTRVALREGVVPSKFDCQSNRSQDPNQVPDETSDGNTKDKDLLSPIINDVRTDPAAFDGDLSDEPPAAEPAALDEELKHLEMKITPQTISSSMEDCDDPRVKLSVTHNPPNCYDLVIAHATADDNTHDNDPNITPKLEADDCTNTNGDRSSVGEILIDIKEENISLEDVEFVEDAIKTEADDCSDAVADRGIDPLSIKHEEISGVNTEAAVSANIEAMHYDAGGNSLNPPVDSKSDIKIEIDLNDSVANVKSRERGRTRVKKRGISELNIHTAHTKCSLEHICEYCDFRTSTKREFINHVKAHDADLYVCGNCHRPFRLEAACHIHMNQCTDIGACSRPAQGDSPATSCMIDNAIGRKPFACTMLWRD